MKEVGLAGSCGKSLFYENGQKHEKMAKTDKSRKLEIFKAQETSKMEFSHHNITQIFQKNALNLN